MRGGRRRKPSAKVRALAAHICDLAASTDPEMYRNIVVGLGLRTPSPAFELALDAWGFRDPIKEPCWSCERERSESVRVCGGKYTFVCRGSSIVIDRHGEPWHQQQEAFNAIASMMRELDAARVVLEAAREASGNVRLSDALKRHASLVDDNEKPSEWTR